MSEPRRMRDDPDADDALRAMLRESPETPGMPDPMRHALGAKIAAIGGAAVHTSVALTAWTWLGVAVLVAAAGAAVWRAVPGRDRPTRPVAVVSHATPNPRPPSLPPSPLAVTTPMPQTPTGVAPSRVVRRHARLAPTTPVDVSPPPATTPPVTEAPPVVVPPPAPPPSTPGAASPEAARRAAENQLLDRARAAVTAGHPDDALRIVAEHERTFPDGRLVEEREVIALEALSRAGRAEAVRERGARFLSGSPRSLYAPRVRRLLRDAGDAP